MTYRDFTIDDVRAKLGLIVSRAPLFGPVDPATPPGWLTHVLARPVRDTVTGEKGRSEFIVAPVLVAVQELAGDRVAIFSGHRLEIDPALGLTGECDFLLGEPTDVPALSPPIFTLVEAKRGELEAGYGQCLAQMRGAQIFNARAGFVDRPVWGCVTNGLNWQFLRLDGDRARIDSRARPLDELGTLLALFLDVILSPGGTP